MCVLVYVCRWSSVGFLVNFVLPGTPPPARRGVGLRVANRGGSGGAAGVGVISTPPPPF